jgi:predicted ATPase
MMSAASPYRPDVPPLTTLPRSLSAAPLPVPPTRLLGRERELARARDLLRDPDVRLLTLTGPGGVGKTRMAQEVARQSEEAFGDGVRFVELAAISDVGLVLPTVARALGIREAESRVPAEVLSVALRDRHLLLVLDNLEQVVAVAPELAGVLAACADIKMLATSRVRLNLRGEQVLPVPPLPTPAHDADTGAITGSPAGAP